jgi:hypothetical protein
LTNLRNAVVKLDRDIQKLSIDQATDIVLRSRRKGSTKRKKRKK